MSVKRTAALLAALLGLVLLAPRAMAQPGTANLNYQSPTPSYSNASAPFSNDMPTKHGNLSPFGPMDVEPDLDMFGPANTSGYGNGPRPKIGWYGSYERLYWSFARPETSLVGSEFPVPNFFNGGILSSTVDTSFINAVGAWGNRWEVGFIDANAYGWQVSVLDHVSQGQFSLVEGAPVAFLDPNGLLTGFVRVTGGIPPTVTTEIVGQLPTIFDTLEMKNLTTLNGVELMRQYRAPRCHNGSVFEFMYGARWFQLDDAFMVRALGSVPDTFSISVTRPTPPGGTGTGTFQNPLADSTWSTRAQNNLIGPTIGGRWYHQREHWITTLEVRGLAAANFHNVYQDIDLLQTFVDPGGNAITNFVGLGSRVHRYNTTFSALGEIRANAAYQLTSNVGLTVGYTGMIVGNISRASNRINYDDPNLIGIKPTGYHQTFFTNGINFGVTINR